MYHRILRAHNGITHVSKLFKAGLSKHHLQRMIAEGSLLRVRKGWVAVPNADSDLIFAARHSLVLSCVTQAARLKLWTRDASQQHFAVPRPGAEERPRGAHLHYRQPLSPRPSFALEDSLLDTLVTVAECQPHEDAVACWDAALGRGLIDRQTLEQVPLRGSSRDVLADSSSFSDSGLESYVRLRLKWLRVPVRAQIWLQGHRVDFLIGDRLVLQIDGGHHVGAQRDSDNLHDATLRLRGYTVMRVGYAQVMNRWHEVQSLIMQAIDQQLHLERRAG